LFYVVISSVSGWNNYKTFSLPNRKYQVPPPNRWRF